MLSAEEQGAQILIGFDVDRGEGTPNDQRTEAQVKEDKKEAKRKKKERQKAQKKAVIQATGDIMPGEADTSFTNSTDLSPLQPLLVATRILGLKIT